MKEKVRKWGKTRFVVITANVIALSILPVIYVTMPARLNTDMVVILLAYTTLNLISVVGAGIFWISRAKVSGFGLYFNRMAIIVNAIALSVLTFLFVWEPVPRGFAYIPFMLLPWIVFNIIALWLSGRAKDPSWLGLYFKKKRLELQKQIMALEKDISPGKNEK